MVLSNLKEGAIKPDIYEPDPNAQQEGHLKDSIRSIIRSYRKV